VYLLCKTLISEHLLLLEDFLSEAHLQLQDRLLVNQTRLRTTIVQEEFLLTNLQSLTPLHITHETTIEVRVQICLTDVLIGLVLFSISFVILSICIPNGRNSEHLNRARCTGVDLDVSGL
jgi:hypothetical protein